MRNRAWIAAGGSLAALCAPLSLVATGDVMDDFSVASRWQVVAAEGVELECSEARGPGDGHLTTLRLDIHFVSGGGYAGIRRELPLELPANFEIAFSLRGDLPRNNLELKLVDETGQNVWWLNRRGFEFPSEWTRLGSRRRHFSFAWGPFNQPIRRASAIEIMIASVEGGRGTIYLDDLTFRPLPETKRYTGTPSLSASSEAGVDAQAARAADGNPATAWQPAPGDEHPRLMIDFGTQREFGGIVVDRDTNPAATSFRVQFSDDGRSWTTARAVAAGGRWPQFLSLPDSEARAVRLAFDAPAGRQPLAVREVEVLPLEATRDANAFAALVAGRAPRGHFPRSIRGEGAFWTVVGSAADDREALVSEDGAVEVDKLAFSVEPFLFVKGRLLTWADATISQSLADEQAPVPTVVREHDGLRLSVTTAADGERNSSALLLNYSVTNTSAEPRDGELYLAVRPFQVNPPYQWLNTVGGVSRIERIALREPRRIVEVDDRQLALGLAPDGFGCAAFDEGDVTAYLSRGELPPHAGVDDPQRSASAAIQYHFELQPGEARAWPLCVPFSMDERDRERVTRPLLEADDPGEYARRRHEAIVDQWIEATSDVELIVPPEAAGIVNTIRSTLAYILINRDGAGIQPGSRSYERSWIRDGSLTATALLRFGLEREAREFVEWYAPYQFASGKVPCVVDRRGPDPVPENDSHGQFIMAVMNVYRFSGDAEFLRKHWSRVEKAVEYIETLRAERMTAEYADPDSTATRQEPGKPAVRLRAFYGLLPESISHEGYSAKPMHSYWDDFFTLKGLKDAAEMARELGEESQARRYQALADEFARTLFESIELARSTHQIDYIPGCVELGDFDATSTTIALWPCGELERLSRPALDRTFERYWEQFVARRDNPSFEWTAYTPYELRCVGTLVLLGQVERAHEALAFFMNDRRPPAWNQWPEVVHRDPRAARFVGDLPHTWCGSDFINAVRMMFLHEREADGALVLLAGVPTSWLRERPVGFKNMPTYGGRLSCAIERRGHGARLVARISGSCPVPRGGIRLTSPLGAIARADVDGKAAEIDAEGRVVVQKLPATVELLPAKSR